MGRPNMSRPSMPHAPHMSGGAHPQLSRPSLPSSHTPSRPQSRPAPASRPTNLGGVSQQRPQTRPAPPGAGNNPVSKLPSQQMRPTTRPAPRPDRPVAGPSTKPAPDFGRPNVRPPGGGGGDRPGANRPNNDLVNANRPGGNRPDLNRPGRPDGNWNGGNRPIDRPTLGGVNRPTTLPANFNNNRPSIGGNRPNRPGGNNNIINNNNTNNNVFINNRPNNYNRPGYNRPGYNRPGNWDNWGGNNWNGHGYGQWNNSNWNNHWYDHHVNNNYHNWYHGCWNGHYNYNWYVPLAVGATAWGLSALTPWTYGGVAYYNPYYTVPTTTVVASSTPAYDYSQPIVLNNYVTTDSSSNQQASSATPAAAPSATETESLGMVDQFRQEFYDQKYAESLVSIEKALKASPKDPVVHELRALNLFALGDYNRAAAALNSLLASAPGMDWTTMSTLYSDTDVYTGQLRKLEDHLRKNPKDASGSFVLGYHYLVLGEDEAAENAFRTVVQEQPRDLVAKRMLDSMTAGDAEVEKQASEPKAPPTPQPTATAEQPAAEKEQPATTQADLVGKWLAKSGDTTVELNVDDKSQFSWKVKAKDQPEVQIAGQLASTPNTLILDGGEQGTLVAQVTPKTANQFEFAMQGAPPEDPKLVFDRQ